MSRNPQKQGNETKEEDHQEAENDALTTTEAWLHYLMNTEVKMYKKGLFELLRTAVGGAQTPLPSSAGFAYILLAIINKILIGLWSVVVSIYNTQALWDICSTAWLSSWGRTLSSLASADAHWPSSSHHAQQARTWLPFLADMAQEDMGRLLFGVPKAPSSPGFAPFKQIRPMASWAALGRALPKGWWRWSFLSTQPCYNFSCWLPSGFAALFYTCSCPGWPELGRFFVIPRPR